MNYFKYFSLVLIFLSCSENNSPTQSDGNLNIVSNKHFVELYKAKTFKITAGTNDGAKLNFSIQNNPKNGTSIITQDSITYIPNDNFEGLDSLTILAGDGKEYLEIPVEIDVFHNPYKDYEISNVKLNNNSWSSPESIKGKYGLFTCDYNGVEREFQIYIPDGISGYELSSTPLFFYFHGMGSSISTGYNVEMMERIAELGKIIFVKPQGLKGNVPQYGTQTGWNYLYPEIREGNEDIQFINALINYMLDNYPASHKKIIIQGFSSGGTFVPVMASENSLVDIVQSMGSILHTYYDYKYEQPIKFQILKGLKDEWHPFEYTDEYPTFWGIEEGMIMIAKQYSCSDTTRTTFPDLDGDGFGGEILKTSCSDGSEFKSFKFVNEAHIQFWGTRPINGYAPYNADISVWDLLNELLNQ